MKSSVQISKLTYDQLDFFIGNEALKCANTHNIMYPMRSGVIENWDLMEKFWHRSIFDYMRAEPDETVFILTEPPMVINLYIFFRILLKTEKPWLKSSSKLSMQREFISQSKQFFHCIQVASLL